MLFYFVCSQAYLKAVNSGAENIQEALLKCSEAQNKIVSTGPQIVHESFAKHKVVDSEDTNTKYKKQKDGTLVTERTKTTQHEVLNDDELPPATSDDPQAIERVEHNVSGFLFILTSFSLLKVLNLF